MILIREMDNDKESSALVQRVTKVLESRLDNDENAFEALKNLSTFYTDNSVSNRRNLRSQIEERSLTINENFLKIFGDVKCELDSVIEDLSKMDYLVDSMQKKLNLTKSQTHQLIEQTNSLQNESNNLAAQQNIAAAFIKRFQLSQEEHAHIYGTTRNVQIDQDFFKTLEKIKQVHYECRLLIQSGCQISAVDIMEQMTLHQEAALEKLYRWAQTHCRNEENGEVSALVRQAMNKLQDRPVLFKYVMDEYCTARRALLVRAFIDAMTIGDSVNGQLAIEMHSHDPKRYVGDMLAWLHQAMPTEREGLQSLLSQCDNTDISERIQQSLCYITDGVCHPLKVRMDRILTSEKQTTILYSIASLVRFYQSLMNSSISGGMLDTTLTELIDQSERTYLMSLQELVNLQLKPGTSAPPNDLSPSHNVLHLMTILKEILSIAIMVEGRQSDVKKIASCVMDPLLISITEVAANLPTTDMAVYLLNCFYHMQCTLALYEYVDDRLERLQAQSEAQLDTLTSEQASSLVANLNLGPIYTILQDQVKAPLSSVPGMDSSSLKLFLGKLNNLMEMPEVLLLPQVSLLISTAHRNAVQRRSFDVIVAIYTQLYERVHKPENNYVNADEIMPNTPEVIRQRLIGV